MPSRTERCSLIVILLCLGPLPAPAQDNPWRVPGYGDGGAWQSAPQRNEGWSGGYGAPAGQAGGDYYGRSDGNYNGGNRWPNADPPAPPRRGWDAGPDGRVPGEKDNYAALGRGPGAGDSLGLYGNAQATPSWRQGYTASPSYSRGYANPGYSVPSNTQQPYLYGHQYGEFPPLEGERRMPSAESLPPQAAPRPMPQQPMVPQQPLQQPQPAVPQAYGYGPGYGYGLYPDPAFGGPSTLGNPLGGYGLYGSPYGIGVPGLYGW